MGLSSMAPQKGCDPKLLVAVSGGLNPAQRKSSAAVLLPLAFETSCRRVVVGGASAPRVTEKPPHAGRDASRGGDAPPTRAPLPRRTTYDLGSHPPATVPFKAPNGALDISHGREPVDQGDPAITLSPQGD